MIDINKVEKEFVLIENEQGHKHWFVKLAKYNQDIISEMSERFRKGVTLKFINDKFGTLTLEHVSKYIDRYIEQIISKLDEGYVVLFNPNGGIQYLFDSTKIIKEVRSTVFPKDTENQSKGLTGWLSPNGSFMECEYGEHYKFAQSYQGEDKDDFIPLGSNPIDSSNSSVFICKQRITPKQIEWFKNNIEFLDEGQLAMLKKSSIL